MIYERGRSTLDVSLWTVTVNAPYRDRTGTVVPARVLNRGTERHVRKRSLHQPFGIAFARGRHVEELTRDCDFHYRFEHRGRGRFENGRFLKRRFLDACKQCNGVGGEVTEHACCQGVGPAGQGATARRVMRFGRAATRTPNRQGLSRPQKYPIRLLLHLRM